MGGILYTILIGAVIGALARLIKPGADPMGWILTILLGIAGAYAGSWLGPMIGIAGGSAHNVGNLKRAGSGRSPTLATNQ